MAELAAKGTYVKIQAHVWYDKKGDRVHITSQDKDLPGTGIHMSAKKGTQTDANLRTMLDNAGCGPKNITAKILADLAADELVQAIEGGEYDAHLDKLSMLVGQRKTELQIG